MSLTSADFSCISPILTIAITGVLVLMLDLFLPRDRKGPLVFVSLFGLVTTAILTGFLWNKNLTGFGGTVVADPFALMFEYVLLVIAGLGVILSEKYIQDKDINHGEYYALLLFSTSGAMLMAAGKELITIFIGLEVLSVALYVLAGFARTEEKSEEAAIKYFLLGAFSSAFFLYGIALMYGGSGASNAHMPTTHLDLLATIVMNGNLNVYMIAGLALILVGLFFKAAIVPFHGWTPDVYQGAPTSVTAFMSAAAKAGAFAVILRVVAIFFPVGNIDAAVRHNEAALQAVLWVFAALTMIVGNVVALWQTDIKRMLAYSSIAHAGYLLVGVAAGNDLGRGAVLFYLLVYTFMNLGAFGIVMLLTKSGKESSAIRDFQGLGRRNPYAAVLMSIFMFSLAGIPPAAGFMGKLWLFMAAVQAHQIGLAVLGLLSSVVGVFYYLQVVRVMWMQAPEDIDRPVNWSPGTSVGVTLCAAMSILLFVFPGYFLSIFGLSTAQLGLPDASQASRPAPVVTTAVLPVDSSRYIASSR